MAADDFAPQIQSGIIHLAEAHDYANNLGIDVWQFAIEVDGLHSFGLTSGDLFWLLNNGYVEHAHEVTKVGDTTRKFRHACNLRLTKRSCFVATDAGIWLTTTEQIRPIMRRAA